MKAQTVIVIFALGALLASSAAADIIGRKSPVALSADRVLCLRPAAGKRRDFCRQNAATLRCDAVRKSTAVPEPEGYWTGPINSAVPVTVRGGRVIHDARELKAMLQRQGTILVDVSNSPRRPDNMAPGAPWMPVPHRAIPGSLWIPGAGLGEIPPATDEFFKHNLAAATRGDLTRRMIIYCHETCWLSWNAAKRAISYGYRHVYWYRNGIEGWKAAGFPTEVVAPRVAPEH